MDHFLYLSKLMPLYCSVKYIVDFNPIFKFMINKRKKRITIDTYLVFVCQTLYLAISMF